MIGDKIEWHVPGDKSRIVRAVVLACEYVPNWVDGEDHGDWMLLVKYPNGKIGKVSNGHVQLCASGTLSDSGDGGEYGVF